MVYPITNFSSRGLFFWMVSGVKAATLAQLGLEPIGTFDARDLSTPIEVGHLDLSRPAFGTRRRMRTAMFFFFKGDDQMQFKSMYISLNNSEYSSIIQLYVYIYIYV